MKALHQLGCSRPPRGPHATAFTRTDLIALLAAITVLAVLGSSLMIRGQRQAQLQLCRGNLQQVSRAILLYADEHAATLPGPVPNQTGDSWWWYKEQVKRYLGLTGPASPEDRVFACPLDRGYSEPKPFCQSARFAYSSYVFNGVTLFGTPNIAGWKTPSVRQPARTLLVMEWAAHGPLSWHRSRTGKANAPFYCDAEGVVAFVDGHVNLTPIYYDGYNAAYTRDPIPGYAYQYSGY